MSNNKIRIVTANICFAALISSATFLVLGQTEKVYAQDRYIEAEESLVLPESQCGATLDFQDVETYDGTYSVLRGFVRSHQRAVGYHVDVGCSGTLIANDIFLSAGHCGYAVGDTVRFNYQRDTAGDVRGGEDFAVTEIIEQVNSATLDYAIVRLEGQPGATYGFARVAAREPAVDELITIIGHPGGVPKQISTGPRVNIASALGDNWFRHQADTLGGSSGSGVIDSTGKLIGVHTNAGCSTGANVQGNHAIRMTVLLSQSETLSRIVSRYPEAEIQNGAGLCLDVHRPDIIRNGGRVQVWGCNGQPQQQWRWVGKAIQNVGGLCLDVRASEITKDGGRVQVWECNGHRQQRWRFENGTLMNEAGLCLDVHAPDIDKNGGRVQVWRCNGTTQQNWSVPGAGLVNGAGLCLEVSRRDRTRNGGRVQVWRCNPATHQNWSVQDGALVNGAGLCLDVHAPDINKNGGRVQVWRCNGQRQQNWKLENGSIINDAGLCLDVHAPDIANNGGRVQVWKCNGQRQQSWLIP